MNVKIFNLTSEISETRFLIQSESCECKCRLNESLCNSKLKWNHNECSCENKVLDNWSSCEKSYTWNPSTCDFECNKACKDDKYLNTKSCSCEKCVIGKLTLECERLNATETLLNDKKAPCATGNYFIHTISLAIICLLLSVVICVGCYFHYTKYRPKQRHLLALN